MRAALPQQITQLTADRVTLRSALANAKAQSSQTTGASASIGRNVAIGTNAPTGTMTGDAVGSRLSHKQIKSLLADPKKLASATADMSPSEIEQLLEADNQELAQDKSQEQQQQQQAAEIADTSPPPSSGGDDGSGAVGFSGNGDAGSAPEVSSAPAESSVPTASGGGGGSLAAAAASPIPAQDSGPVTQGGGANLNASALSNGAPDGGTVNAQTMMDDLVKAGLSPAGAAGVVGNAIQENSLSTATNAGGIGLFQATSSGDGPNLEAYAAQHGLSVNSYKAQVGRVLQFINSDPSLKSLLKTTTNPRQAAAAFEAAYERAGIPALGNRENNAQVALNNFDASHRSVA